MASELTPFTLAVIAVVERIPAGKVMTYGDVAAAAGSPRAAQAVGNALWDHYGKVGGGSHRVVRSTGEPAAPAEDEALRRLKADGTPFLADGRRVDLSAARWRP